MATRTQESYIKQAYVTYLHYLEQQSEKHGQRKEVTYTEFQQRYLEKQAQGLSTKRLSKELAKSAVVFTYNEALRIANEMIEYFSASGIESFDFDVVYNKDGSINKRELAYQIMKISPWEAHDLVASLIDMGAYDSGDDFETYTY